MMKDKRKWGNLLYLIIPILLIGSIAMFSNGRAEKKATYAEIMNLFHNHQITEYNVNFSSGALTYKVKGDNAVKKYALTSVDLFIMGIHEDVVQFNEEHPDAQIKYDYKAGSNNSFWFSMLPMLLITVCSDCMSAAAQTMGSTLRWGIEPCPPAP